MRALREKFEGFAYVGESLFFALFCFAHFALGRFIRLLVLRNKHRLQGVRRLRVRVPDRVEIPLGRRKAAVTEPRLHLLEVHAGVD